MPSQYPRTLLEFEHWFRTEEACQAYLIRLRWPQGFICPRCTYGQAWRTQRGHLHCGGCRRDISVRAGTILEGSKLPLRIWFRAIWWVTNQKSGVSALGLQRTLGLGSYETAWVLLHKLRRAMVRPGRERLSGKVEVDDVAIGGRKRGKAGRHEGKTMIVVAAEVRGTGTGRIRLQTVPVASKVHLQGFVQRCVAEGSEVITDGWWGYYGLSNLGFVHSPVVLTGKGDEAPSAVLPRVHRIAALLKRWLLGTHQGRVSRDQLDGYLDEFAFRFNRRTSESRGMLFYRVLQQAAGTRPAQYRDIVKSIRKGLG